MKFIKRSKFNNSFLILLALFLIFTVSCNRENEILEAEEEIIEEEIIEEVEESEEDAPEKFGIPSPLSGIFVEEKELLERPVVAVMYDNNPSARPHAGLHDAEVIYEFYVEGNATRYLAIFLMNDPELVGPVRSARPYYIEKSIEYQAIFTHAGASSRVNEEIRELEIQNVSLLGPGGGAFWRESHRRAPHNAYTSMENIRSTAKELNYRENSEFKGYEFHEEKIALENGEEAERFEVRYHSNYRAEFRYNEEQQGYDRYYVDQRQYDETHSEEDKKPILASNVVVQIVPTRLIPGTDSGILEMDTIGSGRGYYFTMGEMKEIHWEKNDKEDFTRYFDIEGQEIIFNPGQTWVQVVSREEMLTIEEENLEE